MHGVKRKTFGVISTWKEQNDAATTNRGFLKVYNSLREKQRSETCSTRKTDSRDVLFVVSEPTDPIFRDKTNRWLEGAK